MLQRVNSHPICHFYIISVLYLLSLRIFYLLIHSCLCQWFWSGLMRCTFLVKSTVSRIGSHLPTLYIIHTYIIYSISSQKSLSLSAFAYCIYEGERDAYVTRVQRELSSSAYDLRDLPKATISISLHIIIISNF